MKINRYIRRLFLLLFIFAFLFSACDLVDPTEVDNPQITRDKLFEDATGGAVPLLTGLRFAYADALNRTAVFTETVSDNYDNTQTFIPTTLDPLRQITPNDQYLGDDREIYSKLQILRALADFGLSTILPADAEATDDDMAVAYFYKGMALLMLSENFLAFPVAEGGSMVRAKDALVLAIEALEEAFSLSPSGNYSISCKLALARAYRLDGNKANAVQAANEALSLDLEYVFNAEYHPVDLNNRMCVFALVRRHNDLQPLPRLDFLDPKYPDLEAADPVATLKAEEAYLILAEAALSDGDISGAKTYMNDVIDLVSIRESVELIDADPRSNRPNNSSYVVKADASAPARAGLIFERDGNTVNMKPVSNTSLSNADIDALVTEDELYATLYLLRQEIFFAEGRRMSDLGIRLPLMQRQIDSNPNVNPGDYGTEIYVPPYIPAGDEMDHFTVDDANGVVTILHDMNKILAQNIDVVSPF